MLRARKKRKPTCHLPSLRLAKILQLFYFLFHLLCFDAFCVSHVSSQWSFAEKKDELLGHYTHEKWSTTNRLGPHVNQADHKLRFMYDCSLTLFAIDFFSQKSFWVDPSMARELLSQSSQSTPSVFFFAKSSSIFSFFWRSQYRKIIERKICLFIGTSEASEATGDVFTTVIMHKDNFIP